MVRMSRVNIAHRKKTDEYFALLSMRIRIITHKKKHIQNLPLPIVERIRKLMTLRRPRLF